MTISKSKNLKLLKVLGLMNKKYDEDSTCLIIFPDQSGRIVNQTDATHPYDRKPIINFHNIEDLIQQLEESEV